MVHDSSSYTHLQRLAPKEHQVFAGAADCLHRHPAPAVGVLHLQPRHAAAGLDNKQAGVHVFCDVELLWQRRLRAAVTHGSYKWRLRAAVTHGSYESGQLRGMWSFTLQQGSMTNRPGFTSSVTLTSCASY
jgi:hypothetical protein